MRGSRQDAIVQDEKMVTFKIGYRIEHHHSQGIYTEKEEKNEIGTGGQHRRRRHGSIKDRAKSNTRGSHIEVFIAGTEEWTKEVETTDIMEVAVEGRRGSVADGKFVRLMLKTCW